MSGALLDLLSSRSRADIHCDGDILPALPRFIDEHKTQHRESGRGALDPNI